MRSTRLSVAHILAVAALGLVGTPAVLQMPAATLAAVANGTRHHPRPGRGNRHAQRLAAKKRNVRRHRAACRG